MSPPKLTAEPTPERLTITFQGRLDSAGCAAVQDQLMALVEQAQPAQTVRFDLSGTDFVASAFLRLAILSAKSLGAERFELIHLAPMVREVFAMAGLDRHLRILESGAA